MSRASAITSGVRRLALKGWTAPSIASAYGVTVRTILDILDPPPRPFVLTVKRPPRWRDRWRSDDWRFKDDVGLDLVEHHGGGPTRSGEVRLGGIESNAPIPGIAPEPDPPGARPAASTWSGPASPCQTSLPGGRRRSRD